MAVNFVKQNNLKIDCWFKDDFTIWQITNWQTDINNSSCKVSIATENGLLK